MKSRDDAEWDRYFDEIEDAIDLLASVGLKLLRNGDEKSAERVLDVVIVLGDHLIACNKFLEANS